MSKVKEFCQLNKKDQELCEREAFLVSHERTHPDLFASLAPQFIPTLSGRFTKGPSHVAEKLQTTGLIGL
jgi:hypothetical protein